MVLVIPAATLYSLLANPLEDELIIGIIGIIAYLMAYRAVGKLYDYNIISGRKSGSIVHHSLACLDDYI